MKDRDQTVRMLSEKICATKTYKKGGLKGDTGLNSASKAESNATGRVPAERIEKDAGEIQTEYRRD